MAGLWGRNAGSGRGDDAALRHARANLTSAFLDMDARQSAAAAAVAAAEQFAPEHRLRDAWRGVEAQCFAAGENYLAVTSRYPDDAWAPPIAHQEFDTCSRLLLGASHAVYDFHTRHQDVLSRAAAAAAAAPRLADDAMAAATRAVGALDALDPAFAAYPSVTGAATALDTALDVLLRRRDAGSPQEIKDAAQDVTDRAQALVEAVDAAPRRAEQARRAVSSVATRLDAVGNRATRLPGAYSALLREFNAASSADLVENERAGRARMVDAAAELDAARAALRSGDPEAALARTEKVREHLSAADAAVDGVTGRLAVLRELKTDPRGRASGVRFRIRDAQRLAVDRGLTREWGSVLDAQVERIDRAEARLTGPHPDYWAFSTELDLVSEFIARVVQRMRGHAEAP